MECERKFEGCLKIADGEIEGRFICSKCLEKGELKEWGRYEK